MPWKETRPMDERARFIVECVRGELTMAELCRRYEISRKTGYKWWERFQLERHLELRDRSRANRDHPNATPDDLVALLVATRKAHPSWGPRKVRRVLQLRYPRLGLPAASTVGAILARHGLVRRRRPRAVALPYAAPFVGCERPNAVWCADFKGAFRLGNGRHCTPLTISDAYSRYLLRCESLGRTDEPIVRAIFESAFAEFGLPTAIRTDNGPPFASVAPGGLSRLAIWWIKLGIRAERIPRGRPQANGRHERLHRTLAEDTARPPARDERAQQGAFDRFRRIYNTERPHEALGQNPPATVYAPSPRLYTAKLREPEYPDEFVVRAVHPNGELKWQGQKFYVTQTLAGERVGIEELAEGRARVYFADVPLGLIAAYRFQRERPQRLTPRNP